METTRKIKTVTAVAAGAEEEKQGGKGEAMVLIVSRMIRILRIGNRNFFKLLKFGINEKQIVLLTFSIHVTFVIREKFFHKSLAHWVTHLVTHSDTQSDTH